MNNKPANPKEYPSHRPQTEITASSKLNTILIRLEKLRTNTDHRREPMDYTIRLCQAIVAEEAGYKDRMEWKHLQERG